MHGGSIASAQTWTAADSPHLTIEACAVVRIGGDKSITIRMGGSLTTLGKPGQRVRIERLDPSGSERGRTSIAQLAIRKSPRSLAQAGRIETSLGVDRRAGVRLDVRVRRSRRPSGFFRSGTDDSVISRHSRSQVE